MLFRSVISLRPPAPTLVPLVDNVVRCVTRWTSSKVYGSFLQRLCVPRIVSELAELNSSESNHTHSVDAKRPTHDEADKLQRGTSCKS